MASKKDKGAPAQVSKSSSAQAEDNEHVARTPQSPDTPQGGPVLTGHTTEAGIVHDDDGNVQAVHQTTVVTDPESDLAVQIPESLVAPESALNVHEQPSPNEVSAGADPAEDSVEDVENYHDSAEPNGQPSSD